MSFEIAVRHYSLLENGTRSDVSARIFKPEPDPDGQNYRCRFPIEWPIGVKHLHASGVDAIQALILTLNMMRAYVNTCQAAKEGRLVWLKPGGGFGLPVPRGIEDILQGDDRRL